MKKLLILSFVLLFVSNVVNSQVFGTSSTLKEKKFSLGLEPGFLMSNGNDDFMFFIHGGYGLKSNIDLGVKLGVFGDQNYLGADVEFVLGKRFSLAGGFHDFYDFGIDGTALLTFPLSSSARLTTGLDMDIVMADPETIVPLWIPCAIEVGIKKGMVFILEANIDTKLIDESYSFIGGGVQFYF